MPKSSPVTWTREHFLIALNLYRKLPFGKLDKGNPLIIQVAERMGRSPGSLAMKLVNFASLDPVITGSGRKGLSGATKQDRVMWEEFNSGLSDLGPESEQLLHDLFTSDESVELDFLSSTKVQIERPRSFDGPTETSSTVKVRRGQQLFRQSVLSSYSVRCCISGIDHPRLLVASHIRPWHAFPADRLDPRNGLCLSSLHDAAFDWGLFTLDEDFKVVLGPELGKRLDREMIRQNFEPFAGQPIRLPSKLAEPSQEFLEYHRSEVFGRRSEVALKPRKGLN